MNGYTETTDVEVPVIDGTDVTITPAFTGEGETAQPEGTTFVTEDGETV